MPDLDFDSMTMAELKQLQKSIAKAIADFEDRKLADARAKVESVARDLGFSFAELIGAPVKATRSPAVAKYRHPENPEITWSGRGRKPKWFEAALAAGARAEDMAVG